MVSLPSSPTYPPTPHTHTKTTPTLHISLAKPWQQQARALRAFEATTELYPSPHSSTPPFTPTPYHHPPTTHPPCLTGQAQATVGQGFEGLSEATAEGVGATPHIQRVPQCGAQVMNAAADGATVRGMGICVALLTLINLTSGLHGKKSNCRKSGLFLHLQTLQHLKN